MRIIGFIEARLPTFAYLHPCYFSFRPVPSSRTRYFALFYNLENTTKDPLDFVCPQIYIPPESKFLSI